MNIIVRQFLFTISICTDLNTQELKQLRTNFENILRAKKITFVEWAEFSQGELPFERIEINVTYDDSDDSRIYEFKSIGKDKVLEGLKD